MIQVPADRAPEENPPADPQVATFSRGRTWPAFHACSWRVSSGVSSSSYKDTNPITGALPSWPHQNLIPSQRPPICKYLHLEGGAQVGNIGRTHSGYIRTLPKKAGNFQGHPRRRHLPPGLWQISMGGHCPCKGDRREPTAATANIGLTITGLNDRTSPISGDTHLWRGWSLSRCSPGFALGIKLHKLCKSNFTFLLSLATTLRLDDPMKMDRCPQFLFSAFKRKMLVVVSECKVYMPIVGNKRMKQKVNPGSLPPTRVNSRISAFPHVSALCVFSSRASCSVD